MGQSNVPAHHTWPDYLQKRQVEQRLREQLNEGCRLARDLDERLKSIPEGKLVEIGYCATPIQQQGEAAPAVSDCNRGSIARAAAEVVGAFNEAVKMLLQSSSSAKFYKTSDHSPPSAATSPRQVQPEALKPMKSPSLSPRPRSRILKQAGSQSNTNMEPTPSPPLSIHSPLQLSATTSEMSEGSQKPPHLPSSDDATTTSAISPVKAVLCRKRKLLLPKIGLRMAAGSVESAESNLPPDDGHTWRKYGQKVIHGSLHPRGYYRCTHKADMGCTAVKQVQRCDEEQLLFDVTYKGYHTCRSAELDKKYWPLAFPQGLSSLLSCPNSAPTSAGAVTLARWNASADVVDNTSINTEFVSRAPVISSDTALHQLYVGGEQLCVGYAQDQQSRAFTPLEDWTDFEHSNMSCTNNKRPFVKTTVVASNEVPRAVVASERQYLIPQVVVAQQLTPHVVVANEGGQQPMPHLYGSEPTMTMNQVTSTNDQHKQFGITSPTLSLDDMDNDLLSDYFKSLN